MATVRIGELDLQLVPGAAEEQPVRPSGRWRTALSRSSKSAPALEEPRVDRLIDALERATDDDGILRRSALHHWATEEPLDEAYLVVLAWGLGTTGQWNFMTPKARQALHRPYEHLEASRQAVANGTDLVGLWKAHFSNNPPSGLGSVSFGSKWLYAVGYDKVQDEAQPLVYDNNVHEGLATHARLLGFAPAQGRPAASWRKWCELAADKAQEAGDGVSPADVELALFKHARER